MNRIEALIVRLFLVFISIVLAFALLETAANFYLWNIATSSQFNHFASINQIKARYGDDVFNDTNLNTRTGTDGLLFIPHHFLGYALKPSFERGENRHNSLGFRGDEISVEKSEGVYRIVTLGGSTTYSEFVSDYKMSYPFQLQEHLVRSGFDKVEVVNAGVPAYSSYQSLINLLFRVLPLAPDLLILYQGYNDIHTRFIYPFSAYLGDNSGAIAPYISDTVMPDILEYSTALRIIGIRAGLTKPHIALEWYRLRDASNNYRDEFLNQWSRGEYPSGIYTEVSAMEMLEQNPPVHFERNLRNMVAAAAAHDVEVLLLTFVTSTVFDTPVVASEEYIFALSQHNQITQSVADSTSARLFDLARRFPNDSALFSDGRHMNVEGNLIRAQLIGDYVIHAFLK